MMLLCNMLSTSGNAVWMMNVTSHNCSLPTPMNISSTNAYTIVIYTPSSLTMTELKPFVQHFSYRGKNVSNINQPQASVHISLTETLKLG